VSEPLRLVLIVNPHAGKGRGARAGAEAERVLRDAGAMLTVHRGSTVEDGRRFVQEKSHERPDGIVVVGGDGTLSALIDVLAESDVPVTLVPAGTGNDLARALSIPVADPAAAASAALHGTIRRIDLGEVTSGGQSRLFLTITALGFDAKVSERTNLLRYPRGRLRYYLALIIELVRLRPTDYRIAIDGGESTLRPGTLLAVGNTSSYGGGMPICAGAEPDDGLLDVVHVAPLSRGRLLRLFPLLLRGTHLARPEATRVRATHVHLTGPGFVAYADGERVGSEECTISIRPSAVALMVPKEQTDVV